ncbi:hypothetical protein JZ751_027690 [Albula glossodonta]|uniref:Uncharacterized protein n=1 Tax=Albula glossodonta TaxID=121402 RepID=A0A8T2PJY5_9TELE|nr:hypothetical protein JZ751_027690 [Albula glossodonta]
MKGSGRIVDPSSNDNRSDRGCLHGCSGLSLSLIKEGNNSMNLPPDKARLLRQYDNEKKWELICDQKDTLWQWQFQIACIARGRKAQPTMFPQRRSAHPKRQAIGYRSCPVLIPFTGNVEQSAGSDLKPAGLAHLVRQQQGPPGIGVRGGPNERKLRMEHARDGRAFGGLMERVIATSAPIDGERSPASTLPDLPGSTGDLISVTRRERFQVKNPPHTYIQKLRGYLDPAVTRKEKAVLPSQGGAECLLKKRKM